MNIKITRTSKDGVVIVFEADVPDAAAAAELLKVVEGIPAPIVIKQIEYVPQPNPWWVQPYTRPDTYPLPQIWCGDITVTGDSTAANPTTASIPFVSTGAANPSGYQFTPTGNVNACAGGTVQQFKVVPLYS